MGRAEAILGFTGLAVLVLLVIGALLRRSRDRGTSGGGMDLDGLGTDDEMGRADGAADRPGIFPNFRALLQQVVLPRREAKPDWSRLDGAEGVPGRTVALFDHAGTVYAVNGECRFDALMAAFDWMEDHPGQDPLVVQPTKGGRGRLTLRPELAAIHPKGVRIETA